MEKIRLNRIRQSTIVHLLLFLFAICSICQAATPAPDMEALKKAKAANIQIAKLFTQERYADAIPLAQNVIEIYQKVLTPDHPVVATSLNNLAFLYKSMGDHAQAETIYTRARAIKKKGLKPNDSIKPTLYLQYIAKVYGLGPYAETGPTDVKNKEPEVSSTQGELKSAKTLNKQAISLAKEGRYADAVPLAQRSLLILEKALGPAHPYIAASLHNLAWLYLKVEAYDRAESLYKRAFAIDEKKLLASPAKDQLLTASGLSLYVDNLYKQGRYVEALPWALGVLAIHEKLLAPEHLNIAKSLNNLGLLYLEMGAYTKAESIYKRALAILEKTMGPKHQDTATNLNNLAALYVKMGDYARAEPFYQRALGIREKVLKPEHPRIASNLNNLAVLYDKMGDYVKAESMYKKALAIREKVLTPYHSEIATSLNNLALFYAQLSAYDKAEPMFKRALAIKEKSLKPEHPSIAQTLNNLAQLYYEMGFYGKAEPLYKKALAIFQKVLKPGHPDIAQTLDNLASLYHTTGVYAEAEHLYKRALTSREKVLKPVHPDIAQTLNNLAGLYTTMGDYDKADSLYNRALSARQKVLQPDHHLISISLSNLSLLKAAQGDYREAFNLDLKSMAIDNKNIEQVMGFTSEKEKLSYLATQQWNLYGFFSLVANHLAFDPKARKAVFDTWISRKGVVLEAQSRFQEALAYSDDPKSIIILQKLARVRAQLSKLVFSGAGNIGSEAYQNQIASLEKQKQELESQLSRLSEAFALKKKIDRADSSQIAARLPEGSVLVDFARIKMFNYKTRGNDKKWLPARYFAFVVHPKTTGEQISMIDLGDAEKIEKSIRQFKRMVGNEKDLLKGGRKLKRVARRLHKLVFAPMIEHLDGAREIFISPDGNLNLIPFEVLQTPEGGYLIEDYTFNYLAASRDILGFGQVKAKSGPPLFIGNPDFDVKIKEKTAKAGGGTRQLTWNQAKRSNLMDGMHFAPLPGTAEEIMAIRNILGQGNAVFYTDKDATENALFSHTAPRILHLATHGFFLNDQDLHMMADERGRISNSVQPGKGINLALIENPLLRSGIALAGANNSIAQPDEQQSGGIVTAEKILGLRLRGTQMVVLSACQTGEGEVKTGEGVFGLRRAFVQAGAQSLVMSMWPVPDRETRELMEHFYRNINAGMNRNQALRRAAIKQMNSTRQQYGYAHPFFWGAFVFLGES